MSLLQESVDALTAAAGWKKASPARTASSAFALKAIWTWSFFA